MNNLVTPKEFMNIDVELCKTIDLLDFLEMESINIEIFKELNEEYENKERLLCIYLHIPPTNEFLDMHKNIDLPSVFLYYIPEISFDIWKQHLIKIYSKDPLVDLKTLNVFKKGE